ncbi:hypothetical protein [Streptomyces sp. NPDC012450]|uniref:hypothetical protein n=1 Tax=Streptomyces sp. NPDC012450 TaxID=3364834 RepID=UPI0036ECC108
MARKRDTGQGTEYQAAEAEAVAQALADAYAEWANDDEPSVMDVRAQVEWAGHVMPANNGKRRTRIDLPASGMKKVRKAVEKVARTMGKKSKAKPSSSRKAKGWHAQLRELTEAKNGSAAADRAGLNPSARTLKNWLSDADYPIRSGDRDRISRAYEALKNWNVSEASDAASAASKEAADAMTEAMRDRYGVNVRLRDIDDLTFE